MLLIPLTVVLAANLFFEEHDYDTLKNSDVCSCYKGKAYHGKAVLCFLFLTLPMKLPDI